jgi:hypothetical protein
MSKQRKDAPKCVLCEQPLRPFRTTTSFDSEARAAELAQLIDPEKHPRVSGAVVSYQDGWGPEGNGAFCSHYCGFAEAVARRSRKRARR